MTLIASVGGAFPAILSQCEEAVRQKRTMLGYLVLAVVVFSALLCGGSTYVAFESIALSVSVAVVWFILMLAFERNFLSTMNGTRKSSKWLLVLRLAVATLISLWNAENVMLVVFESAIETRLTESAQEQLQAADVVVNRERAEFGRWQNAERARLDRANDTLAGEVSGTSGTRVPGEGMVARARRAQLDREEAEYTTAMREGPGVQRLNEAVAHRDRIKASIEGKTVFGILERHKALNEIVEREPLAAYMVWLMRLLMFVLEILAFIVKLTMTKDEYDFRVDNMEEDARLTLKAEAAEARQKAYAAEAEAVTREAEYAESIAASLGKRFEAELAVFGKAEKLAGARAEYITTLQQQIKAMQTAGVSPADRKAFHANATADADWMLSTVRGENAA